MSTLEDLRRLPTADLEEAVVFSEWRRLRHTSARSLERTAELMAALGHRPSELRFPVLGVVGSKGKGTAAAYASAALTGLGRRVGTVMSPGVLSNADRIRIDGRMVDEQTRRAALIRIEEARRRLPAADPDTGYLAPTGLFLLMGLLIFDELAVDAAVAEAGIGGASDDLSHWPLEAVVLTQIFGEHLDILGPTVSDVAKDKAAVMGARTRFCVSLADEHPAVPARARATGTVLLQPTPEAFELVRHMPEGFQRSNAAAGVTAALRMAGGAHAPSETAEALRTVNYPGRLSVHEAPQGRCVVDSAVSGPGLEAALRFAEDQMGGIDQVLVCLPPGKDIEGFIDALGEFRGARRFVELPGAYTGTPRGRCGPGSGSRCMTWGRTSMRLPGPGSCRSCCADAAPWQQARSCSPH
ncbi:hypothetical protein [Nesterenkonia sp. NBAIMH1]|uniref:hypothetical protein n=1 Tax=Nesterenkonia sp. NBAIMH1 TaxID=2600320 RepID=UPI0011B5FF81|nr:hypothetical protein [Nesterenkonia sp. NBAIMH1]